MAKNASMILNRHLATFHTSRFSDSIFYTHQNSSEPKTVSLQVNRDKFAVEEFIIKSESIYKMKKQV